ncbi:MAG: hypothetical protein J1G07_02290 [Clostridiales bacterium]|nr:hypothetical protein [Clostridiales bacterium]
MKSQDKKNKENKTSYIITKETLGMTLLLFCAIVVVILLTGKAVFGAFGGAICTFMYGTFGYGSYLVIGMLAYLGEWLVFEKKIKISVLKSIVVVALTLMLFFLFHAVSTHNYEIAGYGKYISECYKSAIKGYSGYTFGGVISALLVYPVLNLGGPVAAYVVYSVMTLIFAYLAYLVFRRRGEKPAQSADEQLQAPNSTQTVVDYAPEQQPTMQAPAVQEVSAREVPPQDDKYSPKNLGNKILFEKGEFDAESYRRNMIYKDESYFNHPVITEEDYLKSFASKKKPATAAVSNENSYSQGYRDEVMSDPVAAAPSSYVYGEKPVDSLNGYEAQSNTYSASSNDYESVDTQENYSNTIRDEESTAESEAYTIKEELPSEPQTQPTEIHAVEEHQYENIIKSAEDNDYDVFGGSASRRGEDNISSGRADGITSGRRERSNANLFDEENDDDTDIFGERLNKNECSSEDPAPTGRTSERVGFSEGVTGLNREERVRMPERTSRAVEPKPEPQPEKPAEKPKHVWKKYVRPGLDLLDDYPENTNVNTGEIEDNKRIIVETLERYKIASHVSNVTIAPAITRYDVVIEDNTNSKRALGYRDAIAMNLKKDNVDAYLNYGKGALSIEVPNNNRSTVGLKSMLTSSNYLNSKPNTLTFTLGKNIDGEAICPDITKMPHMLVAGTTGSGKSVCLNVLLLSLLYKYGPEELRLILVDPKQVELISFDKLPHLMINEIITDASRAVKALGWAVNEMERRYSLFKEMTEKGVATKTLDEYNAHLPPDGEKLAKILIVLDEFADLMSQNKKDIENRIIKLGAKARACGIHLILATQRPSVDCITGLIKSNLPARIGFRVISFDDSRTIFDVGGAEKLLGQGDLYFRGGGSDMMRIQCCFVDTHEVQYVTDFIKSHNETYFDQEASDFINKVEEESAQTAEVGGEPSDDGADTKIDETFIRALKYCVTSNQASVSMIQRRFPVGYIKACKIIDWMQNMNYITQSEGSKPRKVLLTKEEFENTYGTDVDD